MTTEWDDTVSAIFHTIEPDVGRGRAYLVVVSGSNIGEIYPIVGPDMVIGRAAGADLRLNDEGVSRFHCRLRQLPAGIVVEDLASRNGTYCNGERVVPDMPVLAEGDRLQIGTTTVLRFTYQNVDTAPTPIPEDQDDVRDALTGTYGRRYFVDRLETEVAAALRHGTPLSVLLVHIDRFADISSAQGQEFADKIIISVAGHIVGNIRDTDIIARLTGGEFAMLSRSASPGDTFMLAERLRASSAGLAVPISEGPQKITLSLAVAAVHELRIETAHDLLIAAGSALHRARSQGGNRVVLCTQDLLQEPKNRTKV